MHDFTVAERIAAETRQARADWQVVVDITLRIIATRAGARVVAAVVDACHNCVALGVDSALRPASRRRTYIIRKTGAACVAIELLALRIWTTW